MNADFADVGVIVAAAGESRRFGRGNKLLADLGGIPLFCYCIRTFLAVIPPENMVVAAPAGRRNEFAEVLAGAGLPAGIRLCEGGPSRLHSVFSGLDALPANIAVVAVQDAARPLTTARLLERCIESARRLGSGVAARRVTDTIKIVRPDGSVADTPDRETLRAVETPQVFRRDLLERALRRAVETGQIVTDDARAVELLGHPVYLVEHDEFNPKVTFARDLEYLRTLVSAFGRKT